MTFLSMFKERLYFISMNVSSLFSQCLKNRLSKLNERFFKEHLSTNLMNVLSMFKERLFLISMNIFLYVFSMIKEQII